MRDSAYSSYLAEQIERSGLEGKVDIIDELPDLQPAYLNCDLFLLSSRLDPMPNVAIDAAIHGLPIVCFENASGIASLLKKDLQLKDCVSHIWIPIRRPVRSAILQTTKPHAYRRRMPQSDLRSHVQYAGLRE